MIKNATNTPDDPFEGIETISIPVQFVLQPHEFKQLRLRGKRSEMSVSEVIQRIVKDSVAAEIHDEKMPPAPVSITRSLTLPLASHEDLAAPVGSTVTPILKTGTSAANEPDPDQAPKRVAAPRGRPRGTYKKPAPKTRAKKSAKKVAPK